MMVDGQPASGPVVNLELKGERHIQVTFNLSPRIIFCGLEARGKCAAAYGPLIFALDQAPSGIPLDSVILNLGHGSAVNTRLEVSLENGWPVLHAPACTIPDRGNFEPTYQNIGHVDLVPVLLAGINGNPGLIETIQGESMPSSNQERVAIGRFPEYRVLLPFFWSPE
jgi:hypothetical protein